MAKLVKTIMKLTSLFDPIYKMDHALIRKLPGHQIT